MLAPNNNYSGLELIPTVDVEVACCYHLSMRWFSLEEERVMHQSSVSISLSFREPRYQSSRRPRASHLIPTQTNKNLATNAIKGLSIPSRPLARVRSDRDNNNNINIFGIFMI